MKKLQSSLRNMILVLVSAALLMGGILAWVNHVTEGPIALQAEKTLAAGIKTVMGGEKLTVVGTDTITIDDGKPHSYIIHKTQDSHKRRRRRVYHAGLWRRPEGARGLRHRRQHHGLHHPATC